MNSYRTVIKIDGKVVYTDDLDASDLASARSRAINLYLAANPKADRKKMVVIAVTITSTNN